MLGNVFILNGIYIPISTYIQHYSVFLVRHRICICPHMPSYDSLNHVRFIQANGIDGLFQKR